MGDWMYTSTVLALDTSWKTAVSFTPLPLYPREKSFRCILKRRLGGSQSRSESENSWPYRDSNSDPLVVQTVSSRYTDYATAALNYVRIMPWRYMGKWGMAQPILASVLDCQLHDPGIDPGLFHQYLYRLSYLGWQTDHLLNTSL
jgi:hypothetical protein